MKITRKNYENFMFKAIPLLTLAYFIQAYVYLKYGPAGLAEEVVGILGISLVGLFVYHFLHDHYYKINFHPTYLEVCINPLQIRHECLYREIMDVEIKEKNKSYHDVMIHMKNGEVLKLAHVDDAHNIRKYLLERA
jgi:hypothetical protein